MGAEIITTGLSPAIAQTLVAIGADISKLNTAGDLQGGLEQAERRLGLALIRSDGRRVERPLLTSGWTEDPGPTASSPA